MISAEDTSVNILSLNVTLLIEIALFLVMLGILSKWVYPPIVAAAEKRQRQIDDARAQADAGRKQIAANADAIERQLNEAREAGRQLLADAQKSAGIEAESARHAGREKAQVAVDKAREEIRKEREAAAASLHGDVVKLVSAAATRLVGKDVDRAAIEKRAKEVVTR